MPGARSTFCSGFGTRYSAGPCFQQLAGPGEPRTRPVVRLVCFSFGTEPRSLGRLGREPWDLSGNMWIEECLHGWSPKALHYPGRQTVNASYAAESGDDLEALGMTVHSAASFWRESSLARSSLPKSQQVIRSSSNSGFLVCRPTVDDFVDWRRLQIRRESPILRPPAP